MRGKKALINIISSFGLQIITIVCGFIIPRMIIGAYGSNVNGLITSITRFLAYITLLESGFGPVVKSILYKPIANKEKKTIEEILKTSEKFFRKIACIFVVYILILCVIFPMMVSNEFGAIFTVSLVLIIAVSTFAEYYFGMTYKLYLGAEQKTYVISVIQVITILINTIFVLLLIHLGASIHVVKLVTCFIFLLRPIIQNIYVKKKYNIDLKEAKGNYEIKQKWDGLAQHIAYVIHTNTDVAILTMCTNVAEVSVYSIYLMIVNSVKNIAHSFTGGLDAAFGDMIVKNEKENLNKNFKVYEGLYFTISTILFTASIFLIIPFMKLYTQGITDANYIRPVFAYVLIAAEFLCVIRQPYNDLVKAAGHFRQTRIGAWIEAILNITISIILVWNYGIVGVVIGTLIAMTIRTIEFMYYTSKHILNRSVLYTFKRLLAITLEVLGVILIMHVIPKFEITNYKTWILQAIIVTVISAVIVIAINCILYRKNVKNTYKKMKNIIGLK